MWQRYEGWLVRGMLVLSLFGIVATSDDDDSVFFTYHDDVVIEPIELSAERPSVTLVVEIEAIGLAPNGKRTTDLATLGGRGTLTGTAAPEPGAMPLWVSVADSDSAASLFLTEFQLGSTLAFEGNCDSPGDAGSPCVTSFEATFARKDQGAGGGVVTVDTTLSMTTSVIKGMLKTGAGGNEDLGAPPWTVKVSTR